MPEFTGQRDIRTYIRTIWRWKLLILLLVAGAPAIAYVMEHGKQKEYRSSATISVSQASVNDPALSGSSANFSTTNLQAIAALVTTTSIAKVAGDLLKPAQSAGEAVGGVSASPDLETDFLTITAVKSDPSVAAATANAFVSALDVNQVAAAKSELEQQIAADRAQHDPQDQISVLQAALHQNSSDITVIQPATPDSVAIGPHPKRAIELGLVIGILLAVGAVMLLDSVDRRLRTPDDLEELTGLPVLASFAPSAFRPELETTAVDAEAFQTLRTALTYFTVDRPIRSVLVASPGEKEGKSTVAVRLALASARAGLDVILVDADLRRAGATTKLGIEPNVGLALLLAEQRPVESAFLEWPLGENEPGRLRIVAAGSAPPNPAALISSEQMTSLIGKLEESSDLVIIDTPAGLAVSDGVPLMQHVSGVVLVARMNRSSRDTVRRLHKIITAAHGHLLGVVATGVTSGPGYEKYSQNYYAPVVKETPGLVHLSPSAAEPKNATVEPEPSAVEPEPSALEPEPSAVEPEPSAVEPEPATVESEPADFEPRSAAIEPAFEATEDAPQTVDSDSESFEPSSETVAHAPESLDESSEAAERVIGAPNHDEAERPAPAAYPQPAFAPVDDLAPVSWAAGRPTAASTSVESGAGRLGRRKSRQFKV